MSRTVPAQEFKDIIEAVAQFPSGASIEDIFEQAFFVMVHLPYLQPFEDVNKRVSRLVANVPLEIVETELMALHEGNIARYRLRPSEYQAWHDVWRQ